MMVRLTDCEIDVQAVRRIRRWHMVTIRAGREEIS
mgnify:CR=1 FL=1